jgi:DNA-binding response OmpR family regulator
VTDPTTILVVDDLPQNLRLLEAVLQPHGYDIVSATSGQEALARLAVEPIDLVLLDVVMPEIDGLEVCRRLRADEATSFLPVVMITASGDTEKRAAIEAGADDFVTKPFDQAELLARVRSLLRVKRYHDTIVAQAADLAAWNRTLEERVARQVDELERHGRLRRFLSPQLADLVLSSGDDSFLESHRREITVVFCDLRGFTRFAEVSEPEDVMAVPCDDGPLRAVRMAVAMRDRVGRLSEGWARMGYDLHFAAGVAQGHATLGRIGFEGRSDYAAIGSVTNLAARLCGAADAGQILIAQRVLSAAESSVVAEAVGELALHGFARPTLAFSVRGLDGATEPA